MIQGTQEPSQTQKTVAGEKASQDTKSKEPRYLWGKDTDWWYIHIIRYNELHGTNIRPSDIIAPVEIAYQEKLPPFYVELMLSTYATEMAVQISRFWGSRPDLDELLC